MTDRMDDILTYRRDNWWAEAQRLHNLIEDALSEDERAAVSHHQIELDTALNHAAHYETLTHRRIPRPDANAIPQEEPGVPDMIHTQDKIIVWPKED